MIDEPAAFQVGSTVYSTNRHHADDDSLPLGGVVIDIYDHTDDQTGETEPYVRTVTTYRGRIVYANLAISDLDPGASKGLIRADILKQLVLKLGEDEAKAKDPFKHDQARRALHRALVEHGAVPA